ncbi:MAG: CDP-glycerol glycerophosphotransferase family protein [Oscillospiraceae bacterium]|nr:CDP-glycerol glycerophosphotransferase family protein [Oscillospiraceae bacterium]
MPKLSLIFTLAAPGDTLQEALESLRRQTLRGWEFICVAADDIPEEELRKLRGFANHRRGKVIIVPTGTPLTEQRNAALEAATGKYCAFLHSKNRFTPRFLRGLLNAAQREDASLVIGRQRSFGTLGGRDFSSAEALSTRRSIHCTDYRLLWNPSLSNKLYKLEDLRRLGLRFQDDFGFAADALFSLSFAFATKSVASSRRGFAEWREEPLAGDAPPTQAELASYISAYGQIGMLAEKYFDGKLENIDRVFLRGEMKRNKAAYLDQVHSKLLTVLIYRFYRRFYSIDKMLLNTASKAILLEYDKLSDMGKSALRRVHRDLLLDDSLPNSSQEAIENNKITVLLCGNRTAAELTAQLDSLRSQTLPFFELLCDEKLKTLFPYSYLEDPRLRFLSAAEFVKGERSAAIKQLAMDQAQTKYLLILECPALLDSKALQRHWHAIKSEHEVGFTTANYSRFDGQKLHHYDTARLFFDSEKIGGRERVKDAPYYPLDLFWENKLLRLRHLKGLHFTFSSNSALDLCRLYENASFLRLKANLLYLSISQDQLLTALRQEELLLPPEVRIKTHYLRLRSLRQGISRKTESVKRELAQLKKIPGRLILRLARTIFARLPLRDEILFYTVRPLPYPRRKKGAKKPSSSASLPKDLRLLYKEIQGKKRVFTKRLPHNFSGKIKSYSALMRAKIIVTDSSIPAFGDFRLRSEQKALQIWHSCGAFKRFALDAPNSTDAEKVHSQYTAAVTSSEHSREITAHALGLELEQVLALGSPRTDTMLDAEEMKARRQRMERNHPILRGKKVYLYCPTSREGRFDPKIRWKKLSQALGEDEIFIIHRHPLSAETYIAGRYYRRVRDYSYEPLADMLAICHVLVTDYSAIGLEAALLGRPLLFYCPDWEEYERDFYLNFPEDLPGTLVTHYSQLPEELRKTLENPPRAKLAKFAEKQLGACDGGSTQRVVELIKAWQGNSCDV